MLRRPLAGWVLVGALGVACGDDSAKTSAGNSETLSAGSGATSDGGTAKSTATGSATTSASGSGATDSASASATGSSGGAKFDLQPGDLGDCAGTGGGGTVEFSYIWIANSVQGTVSKIDTETTVEVARYRTGPDLEIPDPSRTSVNLLGDVAVSNRDGSVIKIAAREEDCVESNGMMGIQTSQGPNDTLSWGEDECVLWVHDTPDVAQNEGPRPTAWEGGNNPQNECISENPRLWIGWYDQGANQGIVRRLDGDTGVQLDEVIIDDWSGMNWGPYGGAVNKEGDLWIVGWGDNGPLVRIDADTLDVDYRQNPDGQTCLYGMALDKVGDPWVGGCDGNIYHLDVANDDWETVSPTPHLLRGLAIDTEGRAFIAANAQNQGDACLVVVNTDTKQVLDNAVQVAGCVLPVGVSIDFEGFVWVVDRGSDQAFKIDPDTYQVVGQADGLINPYTYSDMTGAGLSLVVDPPQ